MPIYKYDNASLIDEVTIIKSVSGGTRAYLHADANATPEKLGETMRKLMDAGYLSVPYELEGKPVLELRGFGKEDVLLDTLKTTGLTSGTSTKTKIAEDKVSLFDKLKNKSLLISALIYLVGDISYIVYEKQLKSIEEEKDGTGESKGGVWSWLAGYGYLAGTTTSLASMALSKEASESEINKATKVIMEASKRAGIDIDSDSALAVASIEKKENALLKPFTKYSAELMNMGFATAGVAIARNNILNLRKLSEKENSPGFVADTDHKKEKSLNQKDAALGLITTLSGVTSSFVKETPHDPSKPRKKGVAGVGEFFKEKPLRIAGYGYLVSTLIHLVSSIQERSNIKQKNKTKSKDNQDSYGHTSWRLTFVITNLIAEVIMSMSSKGHGDGVKSDASVDTTTCAMVSDMIYKKPKDMREDLVEKMSEFLSMPDALGTGQDKLKDIINEQLASLDKNPWVAATRNKKDPVEIVQKDETQPSQENTNHLERAVASKKEAETDVPVLR